MKFRKGLFLILPGIMFLWIALAAQSIAGGEDGVMHYLFARYAPEHPGNFLNHWAKPLFVLLSSPFAQFGILGVQVFNILLALASAWFVWRSAENFKLAFPWLAPVLLLFASIYFYTVPSALTEILFSFLLSWAIYEASRQRFIAVAILVSFLPFARSEGNGLIAVFALGLTVHRQWKTIPFLALGSVVYSLAGWGFYNDLFWIWTQHPYVDASHIYGSGGFFDFLKNNRAIWGNPLYLFWILGTLVFLFYLARVIRKKAQPDQHLHTWLFFIFGSCFTYLLGHSLMWYLGKSASLGLIRVMAAVMPPTALIAHYGFDRLVYLFNPNLKMLRSFVAIALSYAMIVSAFHVYQPPFEVDRERKEIEKMAAWYLESPYSGKGAKIYFHAPSMAEALQIDLFDTLQSDTLANVKKHRILEEGSLIAWDAHFGPNESGLPLDSLLQRPDLEMIYHQEPEPPFRTLNGYDYEIYLFRTREKN